MVLGGPAMTHRNFFITLIAICGLVLLAGCGPDTSQVPTPTTVFIFPTAMPLDTVALTPLPLLPSDTPPITAAPIVVNNPIEAQTLPVPVQPTVNAAPGTLIQSFTANPGESDPGGAVTLAWHTTGSGVSL